MASGKNPSREAVRQSLPEELRPVFDELEADYRFAAMKHHGKSFVSYKCLAELLRNGWRPSAEPLRGDDATATGEADNG